MATVPVTTPALFKTILFATDFSSSSEAALPFLTGFARCFDSTVIATHAVPFEPATALAAVPPMVEFDLEWRQALQAMRTYKLTHPFTELRHQFVLERGFLRDVVADVISRNAVDLVVVGTHGRQGFRKFIFGSLAEQLLRTISCPILTVGPGVTRIPPDPWKPRRILFATEFSKGSMHALPRAIALAGATDAELLIMHAVPLVSWQEQAEVAQTYEQRIQTLISELPHRCPIQCTVVFDLPAPAIIATAQEREADLIVMGAHHARLPRLDAHVPGTTVSDVIGTAHCPVLTVSG